MQLKRIMKHPGKSLSPEVPLRDAAAVILSSNARAIPVCDRGVLVGMLTSRDLVVRATAQGRDPAHSVVRDIMSREVTACFETEDSGRAAELMRERRLAALFVVNDKRHLVGVVYPADMVRVPFRPAHSMEGPSEPKQRCRDRHRPGHSS